MVVLRSSLGVSLLAVVFAAVVLAVVAPVPLNAQDNARDGEQFAFVSGPGGSCAFRRTGPAVTAIVTTPVQSQASQIYCQVPEGFRPLTQVWREATAYIGDPGSPEAIRAGVINYFSVDPDSSIIDGGGHIENASFGSGYATTGVNFELDWFTATHVVTGAFANLEEHRGGKFTLERGGHFVRARLATDRSPVQHWARQKPADIFRIPEGYRPHVPVLRTVEGAAVNGDGVPVDPPRVVVFEIAVAPDGAARYVDGQPLDDVGYLAYELDVSWETAPSPDRPVLEDLHAAIYAETRDEKSWPSNWGRGDVPLAEWSGVSTDAIGRVTHLELRRFGAYGAIPPSIGRLGALKTLHLGGGEAREQNWLRVAPEDLASLTRLESLNLDWLPVTGALPPEWAQLTNLRTLLLRGTGFTGPLPPEWSELRRLEVLDLGQTAVSGRLPPEWSGMQNLERLVLSSPHLEGPLPKGWATMPHLRVLDIRGTPLTGSLPPEWSRMPRLEHVRLWHTELDPLIPAVWGMNRSLQFVHLENQSANLPSLRQEYLRGLLNAHDSEPGREETRCRDGHVSYVYHCNGTETE